MMIIRMYITLMPVILAGIINMLFVKTSICKKHRSPMDHGKILKDGRRLFGDNKTWIGFAGMIFSNMFSQVLWGMVCDTGFNSYNYIYQYHENSISINLLTGACFGLVYVLCELPNSFIKRRIDIPEGQTVSGWKGRLFFIVDQTDSLIGVTLFLACLYPMSVLQYVLYIMLGAGTHVAVNFVLYKLKIRKNL